MNHRHSYKFEADRVTNSVISWKCQDCGKRFYMFRHVYLRLLQGFYRVEVLQKPSGVIQQYVVREL